MDRSSHCRNLGVLLLLLLVNLSASLPLIDSWLKNFCRALECLGGEAGPFGKTRPAGDMQKKKKPFGLGIFRWQIGPLGKMKYFVSLIDVGTLAQGKTRGTPQ